MAQSPEIVLGATIPEMAVGIRFVSDRLGQCRVVDREAPTTGVNAPYP